MALSEREKSGIVIGILAILALAGWLIFHETILSSGYDNELYNLVQTYYEHPGDIAKGSKTVVPLSLKLRKDQNWDRVYPVPELGILTVTAIKGNHGEILVATYRPLPGLDYYNYCTKVEIERFHLAEMSGLAYQYYGPGKYKTREEFFAFLKRYRAEENQR